jgi:hypothetical protein
VGGCHVLIDIVVSTSGFGIEFQSKTLRSTGAPGLTVICEAPVESARGWSKEGGTGHAKVGTRLGDGCRMWLAGGPSRRSKGTSESPEICWLWILPREIGGSGETTTVSNALPQSICPMELKARESGEGFEHTENDVSDSWTDVAGFADVWANASVVPFLEESMFDGGCMTSEWGWLW